MTEGMHAKVHESVHTMTLRLPDGLYEVIRKRAFDERTSITSQIVVALREQFGTWGLGCDEVTNQQNRSE